MDDAVTSTRSTSGSGWRGTALLRPGVLAFSGSIGPTGHHAHHAVQVMTGATPLTVIDGHGVPHSGATIAVPADAGHRIAVGADDGVVIFLEPETAAGQAAHRRSATSGWVTADVLGMPGHRPLSDVVADFVRRRTPSGPAAPVEPSERHHAVESALRLLPEMVAQGPVSGTALAAEVGVSVSRLTHLFSEQVGLPLRRYVLWSRLRVAIVNVQNGADLTGAAHAAGFSDSAHLTRTTRTMFGLPPSILSRHVRWDLAGLE
ncbi:AraC family transcriptional regulator [Mycobacterium sp. SWH-M5]|nr:AraC family transcriptional regulator [Mycobacterium sp. SWH-M5]